MSNTKDRGRKRTLLHFLVEVIEREYPQLMSFSDELIHVESAAKISLESIQSGLKQLETSINTLENELKIVENNMQEDEKDKWV